MKNTKIEIVAAQESHMPGLIEVFKELMSHHKDIDYRFPMKADSQLVYQKRLLDYMNNEHTQILAALEDNEVVGFASLQIVQYPPVFEPGTYGIIDDMGVKAKCRRKGIGEKLLKETYKWFKSKNVDRVELSVLVQNNVGYSFWEKQGFKDYLHRMFVKI